MKRRKFLKFGSLFVPTAAFCFPAIIRAQSRVSGSAAFIGAAQLQGTLPSGGGGSSPVGWWKLNDGSGTSAVDSSGNGFTGTLHGTDPGLPTWGTGPNSNGDIVFSSVSNDQYVDFGSSSTLKPTAAGTFMCWINTSTTFGAFRAIMSNGNETTDRNGCTMFQNSGSKISFEVCSASAANTITGGTTTTVNTWYHFAGTWDGSFLNLYVNGASDATAVAQTLTPTPSFNFTIGWDGNHSSGLAARCPMDDVRVYATALSAGDILTIYNAGAQ